MFQMKKILLTTLLVLVSLAAAAQKRGSVTATVLDDETGETVPGAVLTVAPVGAPDKKQYFTSAYKGSVSIPSLAYGEYSLSVAFLGYDTYETTFGVKAARQSLTVLSHCEDRDLVKNYAVNEGQVSRALGIHGRPAIAEELMVMRDAMLAEETGAPVHICHVSTARSVAIIRSYKHKGVPITCETCPQYFTLTEEEIQKQGTMARVNPPLRTKADVEGIIAGLRDGTIDAIATDHAPHSVDEKARPLSRAPSGMIGLETSLALALTQLYHTKKLDLPGIIRRMSTNPADILHLARGHMSPGAVADLVVFDPDEEWSVDPERFASKARNTPFAGRTVKGRVKYTISKGQVIYQDN